MLANLRSMDGQSEAIVDVGAIRSNVAAMAEHVGPAEVMAVVKSNGYGHGLVQTAAAALAGGAPWLGVGHIEGGLALRSAGLTAPVLCRLASPDAPHRDAIAAGVDLSAGTASLIRQIGMAAGTAGLAARVHLKADTGMSRGGAPVDQWPGLRGSALAGQAAGRREMVGVWAHLARAFPAATGMCPRRRRRSGWCRSDTTRGSREPGRTPRLS